MTTLRCSLLLALLLAAPLHARAQGEIFLCTDEEGRKTYQNTGAGKNCKRVDVQPIMTVPAPKLPPAARSGGGGERATPANFPRVDGETQRSRDSDRRRILEDELRLEEERLARLREEFNNGQPERRGDERNFARYQERVARLQEDIQRSEGSLAALKRELALQR